ncbi:MAG: three-helix bundle dimerization domain-containing protein [Acidimicrobiales bacterium]
MRTSAASVTQAELSAAAVDVVGGIRMGEPATNETSGGGWPDEHGRASEHRAVPQTSHVQDDLAGRVADLAMVKAIAHAVDSVQARYPTAPSALVRDCVYDAFDQLRSARITLYLPILIERSAGRAVADAIRWEGPDR